MLIPTKQVRFPKVQQYPARTKWDCPVCRAKGLYGEVVDLASVMTCGICGSIFSEIVYDKNGKVIKATKIGERRFLTRFSPFNATQEVKIEQEPYSQMLEEPIVIESNA